MAKCGHPDCEVALGLTATDLGPLCGLHLEHAKDIIRGEQRLIDAETRISELQSQLNEAKAGWDSAIADLQSQLDAKWISVETAMPEYDTDIVLWAQGWPQVYVGYWRHSHDWIGRQRGESDGPLPDTNPTHWQPLPPPPAGAKGETKP